MLQTALHKAATFIRPQARTKIISIESLMGLTNAGVDIAKVQNYAGYLEVGTKKVWATFKACDLIGKAISDTPYGFEREGLEGERVGGGKAELLLNNPNPYETFTDMLIKFVFHIKLTGNSYWLKEQPNANGEQPKQLFSLNPKRMRAVVDPKRGLTGWLYMANGREVPFELQEIIHFKSPHADNDFYGLGDVQAAEDLFSEFINRENWAKKFWKNGASPSGVLICEDAVTVDQSEFDRAKKAWAREYSGTDNSGKTAWLLGKWKHEKIGLSSAEMQNIEGSKFTLENIFHLHGVPLSIAGMQAAANFATARVDKQIFQQYTVKPLIRLFTETINSDLIQGFDPRLSLEFDVSGLIDLESVAQHLVPIFNAGAISLNELRQAAGFNKMNDPLFDQHFINAGLVPLDLAGIANQDQAQQQATRIVDRFVERCLNGVPEQNGRS